jgi:hypothetical protein
LERSRLRLVRDGLCLKKTLLCGRCGAMWLFPNSLAPVGAAPRARYVNAADPVVSRRRPKNVRAHWLLRAPRSAAGNDSKFQTLVALRSRVKELVLAFPINDQPFGTKCARVTSNQVGNERKRLFTWPCVLRSRGIPTR